VDELRGTFRYSALIPSYRFRYTSFLLEVEKVPPQIEVGLDAKI
jgi:hypothetical protein